MLAAQQRRLRANSDYRVEWAGRAAWARSEGASALIEVNRVNGEKVDLSAVQSVVEAALGPIDIHCIHIIAAMR